MHTIIIVRCRVLNFVYTYYIYKTFIAIFFVQENSKSPLSHWEKNRWTNEEWKRKTVKKPSNKETLLDVAKGTKISGGLVLHVRGTQINNVFQENRKNVGKYNFLENILNENNIWIRARGAMRRKIVVTCNWIQVWNLSKSNRTYTWCICRYV